MRRFVPVFSGIVFFYLVLAGILPGPILSVPPAFSAGSTAITGDGISLFIHAGRMDAALEGETMRRVMEEVARQSRISIFVEKSLLDTPLTVRFRNLSVEEGLRKMIGQQSYAMVFSAKRDALGNHPVKAIRVYPRGEREEGPYLYLRQAEAVEGGVSKVEMSREAVDIILARNDEITRSAIARRIEERKNGKVRGDTPGRRTPVAEAIYRVKQARKFKALRAGTLARRSMFEAQEYARIHRKILARERSEYEHHREEMLRERRFREGQR